MRSPQGEKIHRTIQGRTAKFVLCGMAPHPLQSGWLGRMERAGAVQTCTRCSTGPTVRSCSAASILTYLGGWMAGAFESAKAAVKTLHEHGHREGGLTNQQNDDETFLFFHETNQLILFAVAFAGRRSLFCRPRPRRKSPSADRLDFANFGGGRRASRAALCF